MKTLKIGTRGSPLALVQAEMTRAALEEKFPDLQTEIIKIHTSGEWNPKDGEVRLKDTEGGKGQFAKEIESALLAGDIDCGVHSMKDMDSHLPDGLILEHMLPRQDPRDAILYNDLANNGQLISALPKGFTVGTASVRRQAFLLAQNPDLNVVPFRGNVGTRLEKLKDGQVDATLLALAGLNRLGLQNEIGRILEPEEMLPAAGQGAVGIELRADDSENIAIFDQLNHRETTLCVLCERAALAVLDGSCHTPIGAYAIRENGQVYVRVCVVALDGSQKFDDEMRGPVKTKDDARTLGAALGHRLKARIPPGILAQKAD